MPKDISPELLNFFDKFVDRQSNANMGVAQKLATIETNMSTVAAEVKEIGDEFHNGFRSELKQYLDNHVKDLTGKLEEIDKKVDKFTKLGYWLRNIAIIIGGIAAIFATVAQILMK